MTHFIEYRDVRAGETVRIESDRVEDIRSELYPAIHDGSKRLIASSLTRPCPGYGEDCGTQTTDDLCGDCALARMDEQSPRVCF